jgi:3-oxoacyl-[acyl-carrier-protein] synthase II
LSNRVVVTGIGMITPVGLDTASSWSSLVQGVTGVDHISAFDAEPLETHIAAEVKGYDPADYLDKKKARHLDRFAQFAMVATQEAVWQAELEVENVDPTRVAVIIGSGVGGLGVLSEQVNVLRERGSSRVSPFLIPMMLSDMASGQVSIALGARGLNFCPVSSCASGAEAIGQAWNLIRRGEVDVVIAGGAEAPIVPIAIAGFNACQALSKNNADPTGASRPFDARRDGFVMGEGSAIMVMESMESARRRNAQPLAEVVGYGATSDAYHVTHPAPGGEGAARAMRIALAAADMRPNQVGYINAHGTSTMLNDKVETEAIKEVFGEEAHAIPISSTKSMTGHLLGAGAALEAAICVVALQKGQIPPTINLNHPDPDCDLNYTPNEARKVKLNTAMTNSLGFGGHNSVLVFRSAEELA